MKKQKKSSLRHLAQKYSVHFLVALALLGISAPYYFTDPIDQVFVGVYNGGIKTSVIGAMEMVAVDDGSEEWDFYYATCTPDEELGNYLVDYGYYAGFPGYCDCYGSCWDAYGYWYADPFYPDYPDGSPLGFGGCCDGIGNCWDDYGYWYADPVFADNVNTFEGFWDVPPSDPYYDYVTYVGNLGIFTGYDDGSFQPYRPINRAETAKVVLGGFAYTVYDDPGTDLGFTDLVPGSWYMPYLYTANMVNVMTGDANGTTMRPGDTGNKVEMLRIFLEAANVPLDSCVYGMATDVLATDWHCKYVQFALVNDSMDYTTVQGRDYFYPATAMTRGDVAELFYRYNTWYMGAQ